ncbi:hypothetical protein [Rhizobium leucaenae]|uniref:hypothetical protein n=1 Tax=Rhizobium leucaenae TaxID=29450 RepID=UPI0007EE6B82|nr:hypothetical protein [Rhizobium leucaenae]
MSSPAAYDAIHDHLTSSWSGPALAFENDGFQLPATPDYWVLVEIFADIYDQASIGAETVTANLWREEGQILAHVMTPRGAGTGQARTYAQQFIDLFRGQEIGGVVFETMSIGAGNAGDATGAYFRMTATIDWYRDV